MTTIGITASGMIPSAGVPAETAVVHVRTRLRLTRRGRRVIAALAALPAVVGLAVALVVGGGAAFATKDAGTPVHYLTVTVESGQSLWSIAEDVAPHADPRDVVDAIIRLNALDSATLTPGEELAIPTEYAPSH